MSLYKLVTDASTLAAGDEVIIVCGTKNVAMSTSNSDTSSRGKEDVTITDGEITNPSDKVMTFELQLSGQTSGDYKDYKWLLASKNYEGTNGYLSGTASNSTNLAVSNVATTTNKNWANISFDSNNVKIIFGVSSSRYVQYDGTSAFKNYASSANQTAVQLYRYEKPDNGELGTPVVTFGDEYANIAVSGESYEVYANTPLKVTCKNATAIEYKTSDATEFTSGEGNTLTFDAAEFTTYTFRGVKDSSYSEEFTVIFTEKQSVVYEKVTSSDGLIDGGHYLVVYEGGNVALSTNTNTNTINGKEVTISNSTITNPSDEVMVLEAVQADGGWYWLANNYSDGSYYLSNTAKSNYLKMSQTACLTTVSFSSNNVVIDFGSASENRTLQYYSSGTTKYFSTYSSTQKSVQLYKLDEVVTPKPSAPVVTYSYEDGEAVTAESENAVRYYTKVTVTSENATELTVTENAGSTATVLEPVEFTEEKTSYEFNVTKDAKYVFVGKNGEKSSSKTEVSFSVRNPNAPVIKVGDDAVDSYPYSDGLVLTIESEANTGIKYSQDNGAYSNLEGNSFTVPSAGTYSFKAYDSKMNTYVSDVATIKITLDLPTPSVSINDEEVTDFNETYNVYQDTPITVTANGATKFKVASLMVEDKYIESGDDDIVNNQYTFYPFTTVGEDVYTITAYFGDEDNTTEVELYINYIKHAAPVVTVLGETIANNGVVNIHTAHPYSINVVAEGATHIELEDENNKVTTCEGSTASFELTEAGYYRVTALYGTTLQSNNYSELIAFTVRILEKSYSYELVKDVADLVDGGYYLIVNKDKSQAMTSATPSNSTLGCVGVTVGDDDVIFNPSTDAMALKLAKTDDGWNLLTGDKGIALTVNNTSLKIGDAADLNIAIASDGIASISIVGETSGRTIQYNPNTANSSPRFGYYVAQGSTSEITPVCLYKFTFDSTPEIKNLSEIVDGEDCYYLGNATVEYRGRYSNSNDASDETVYWELWLRDDSTDSNGVAVSVHAIIEDNLNAEINTLEKILREESEGKVEFLFNSGYSLYGFKLSLANQVTSSCYDAILESMPETYTEKEEDYKYSAISLAEGTALTDAHVGKGVIVTGTISAVDEKTALVTSGDVVYTLVNHFAAIPGVATSDNDATSEDSANQLFRRFDTDDSATPEYSWSSAQGWISENIPAENTMLLIGGLVDKDGESYVIYPVTISTDGDAITSVSRLLDSEGAYMVGRDIYLPEGAVLYGVNGVRVATTNVADGIYIIRYANGSASKLLVR